jgi:hypothetical protein
MNDVLKEYQEEMGWNDSSVVHLLVSYLKSVMLVDNRSVTVTNREAHLREFLEARADEERNMAETSRGFIIKFDKGD